MEPFKPPEETLFSKLLVIGALVILVAILGACVFVIYGYVFPGPGPGQHRGHAGAHANAHTDPDTHANATPPSRQSKFFRRPRRRPLRFTRRTFRSPSDGRS